jgi:hypothetical protein
MVWVPFTNASHAEAVGREVRANGQRLIAAGRLPPAHLHNLQIAAGGHIVAQDSDDPMANMIESIEWAQELMREHPVVYDAEDLRMVASMVQTTAAVHGPDGPFGPPTGALARVAPLSGEFALAQRVMADSDVAAEIGTTSALHSGLLRHAQLFRQDIGGGSRLPSSADKLRNYPFSADGVLHHMAAMESVCGSYRFHLDAANASYGPQQERNSLAWMALQERYQQELEASGHAGPGAAYRVCLEAARFYEHNGRLPEVGEPGGPGWWPEGPTGGAEPSRPTPPGHGGGNARPRVGEG